MAAISSDWQCSGVTLRPTLVRPAISMALHAKNRQRLAAALRADGGAPGAVVVLQSGETDYRHETDHEKLFRQESFFAWTFGVKEPDCYGSVAVDSGRSTLFVPRLPASYAVVMGAIKTPAEFVAVYGVDEVRYVDEMEVALKEGAPTELLLLRGFNTDGKRVSKPADFEGLPSFKANTERLWPAITECRVFKTPEEVELLRYSAAITSEAHIAVMQHCTSSVKAGKGGPLHEFQLESLFQHWCYYNGGCRNLSYTCICASGPNGAVLHYGHAGEPNSRAVVDGDMCLFDMGSEYHCYGSDITTTFPSNGVFTVDQRLVYDAVLGAVKAVEDAMRPGTVWLDMQTLAYKCVLTSLKAGGLLTGDVEGMMAVNLGATFMPHGLGHFLGLDTHDVGGYNHGHTRPELPGYASLRTVRPLAAGMYLTVEPGCYFIDPLLDAALADPSRSCFLVPAVLERFRKFGGVRIEDDVLVTETGISNLTRSPREPQEVEDACAGRITSIEQVTVYRP